MYPPTGGLVCLCNNAVNETIDEDAFDTSAEFLRDERNDSETSTEPVLNNDTESLQLVATNNLSFELFSSVNEVKAYLDSRFGNKRYVYHVKTGWKNHCTGSYYASFQCFKSGLPKRACVSLLLYKTVYIVLLLLFIISTNRWISVSTNWWISVLM